MRAQVGLALPDARTALVAAGAAGAAAFAGLQIAGDSSIGVGTVLVLVFVPVVLANPPLGIAVWLGMLFSQWLPGINTAENAASGLLALTAVGLLAARDGRARDALRRHAGLLGLVVALGLWLASTSLWAEVDDLALQDVKRWTLAITCLPVVIVLVASARDVRVVFAGFVVGAVLSVFVGLLLALLERNFIYSWATIRRSVVDDVGGFRTDLRSCEDHELWLRAAASGHGVAEAPGRLTIYRRGRPTLTYDAVRMAGASREVCRTVAEDLAVPPVVRVRALEQVRRLDRELAVLAGRRPLAGAARRLKLGLIPLKERALDRRSWYAEPPPEVAAAFPELATGRAPGS